MAAQEQHVAASLLIMVLLCCARHVVAGAESVLVTCGSTIKLAHVKTQFRLHSHEVAYSRGSQQQSVTAFPTSDNGQSYWIVQGPQDEASCIPGSPIKKGQRIRLQHSSTRRWLHSHQFYSPITGGLEVSAFGDDGRTDGGDVWKVEWDGKAKYWKQDTKVRIKHVDTSAYLSSQAGARFGHPIGGQQEVAGTTHKSKDAEWTAVEGIYYPRSDKAPAGGGQPDSDKDEL